MTHATAADTGDVSARTGMDTAHDHLPRLVVATGFVILALSYMINAMDRQVFFPLLPQIRHEYGFNLPEGGLLATGFTLGMALAGLPAGYLVDRFTRKTVLVLSVVLYSLGTLATPLASGWGDMAAYRLISGFGEGMQSAALFAAVGAYFFHRRALALGGIGAAFGLGVLLGPMIGVNFANAHRTWRAPFLMFGICGLAVAMIAVFLVSSRMTERTVDPVATTKIYDHMPASPYNRNSIALAVSSVIGGLVVYGFLGLYPTFLITTQHYTAAETALAMSCFGFGGMLALVAGWLGDRNNQRNILIVTYLAVAATSAVIYQVNLTVGWQCVCAFVMGAFATGALYPNINSAMQRSVRPEQVGRATGLFITSYYVSSAFSGLLFAALVGWVGWHQAGLWQVSLLSLIAVVPLAFVRTSEFNNAAR